MTLVKSTFFASVPNMTTMHPKLAFVINIKVQWQNMFSLTIKAQSEHTIISTKSFVRLPNYMQS